MNQITTFGATQPVASPAGHSVFETSAVISNLFHRPVKTAETSVTTPVPVLQSVPQINPDVLKAVQHGDELIVKYGAFKAEFLDRSDRALWELLGYVYDYVRTINASAMKREIKKALIKTIKAREPNALIATNAETEAIAVRYVFGEQARQTRSNYTVVLEKAIAVDVPVGGLAAFLEEHKGVVNVIEKSFDGNDTPIANTKEVRSEQASWMRRLFSVMAHTPSDIINYEGDVVDFNLSIEEASKLKESAKKEAKNQQGNFVFFVAVPAEKPGTYKLVHGVKAAQDFENSILHQIASRMGHSNDELKTAVCELESAVGLIHDQGIAQKAA